MGITLGTATWQLAPTERATGAGVFKIVGGVVSTTVKRTAQLALLPDASVTVTVTGCGPKPTSVPAAGLCVIRRDSGDVQVSLATTWETKLGTAA